MLCIIESGYSMKSAHIGVTDTNGFDSKSFRYFSKIFLLYSITRDFLDAY